WEYNPTGFHDTFRENMQAAASGGRPAAGGNAAPAPRTRDSEVPPSLQRKVASELQQNGLAVNVQRKPGPAEAAFDAIEGAVGGVIGGVAGAVGTAGKMLGSLASAAAGGGPHERHDHQHSAHSQRPGEGDVRQPGEQGRGPPKSPLRPHGRPGDRCLLQSQEGGQITRRYQGRYGSQD